MKVIFNFRLFYFALFYVTGLIANQQSFDYSNLITVITLTNPDSPLPGPYKLCQSHEALSRHSLLSKATKIIVFDGIDHSCDDKEKLYENDKLNLTALTIRSPIFSRTKLIFCDHRLGQAGALREALKEVNTPYVFIYHDDSVLDRTIDLNVILSQMESNLKIKHVCVNHSNHNQTRKSTALHECYEWSLNDHISRKSYYENFVLPQCDKGAIEPFMQTNFQNALNHCGYNSDGSVNEEGMAAVQAVFGTYLYE